MSFRREKSRGLIAASLKLAAGWPLRSRRVDSEVSPVAVSSGRRVPSAPACLLTREAFDQSAQFSAVDPARGFRRRQPDRTPLLTLRPASALLFALERKQLDAVDHLALSLPLAVPE